MHQVSMLETIRHYTDKKTSGEMDMSQIRAELKQSGNFGEDDIKEICQKISDREFYQLTTEKKTFFSFFNHIIFSWLFLLVNAAIIVVSIIFLTQNYPLKPELQSDHSIQIYAYLFIGGAAFLMIKRIKRIRQYSKK